MVQMHTFQVSFCKILFALTMGGLVPINDIEGNALALLLLEVGKDGGGDAEIAFIIF